MLKNWKAAAVIIWASGIAACAMFWYPGGHYIGPGIVFWLIWISLVTMAFFTHRARRELRWACMPIVLFTSSGPALIISMALPYMIDRLMGRSIM